MSELIVRIEITDPDTGERWVEACEFSPTDYALLSPEGVRQRFNSSAERSLWLLLGLMGKVAKEGA